MGGGEEVCIGVCEEVYEGVMFLGGGDVARPGPAQLIKGWLGVCVYVGWRRCI